MAYVCSLGNNQQAYVENVGTETVLTLATSTPGQQQQSSNRLSTGAWTAPPQAFSIGNGVVIQLTTTQGPLYLQLQGSQIQLTNSYTMPDQATTLPLNSTPTMPGATSMQPMQPMQPMEPMQPMQPMRPMEPMQPMQMGDMQMSMNPMEMRMGDMAMRMGQTAESAANQTTGSSQQSDRPKFCTQCGAAVQVGDRFCGSCGHSLRS